MTERGELGLHPFLSLPDGWRVNTLKELTTKIGSGATPRGGSEAYLIERQTFALARSQNVFDRHFDGDSLVFISNSDAERLRNVWLQPGDVLLNITGDGVTFGRSCLVSHNELPCAVNQHVAIIRCGSELEPGYLLGFLSLPETKKYIESFNAGGSRRAITKGHIESFLIPKPPLEEQKRIAAILGALDNKIEVNRKVSKTLEESAQALFKSWFIDFDPVIDNALRAGNPIPDKLAAKVAIRREVMSRPAYRVPSYNSVFPDAFTDSQLGPIPKKWVTKRFEELSKVVGGGTPSTKNSQYWNNGMYHWATPKDLSGQRVPVLLTTERKLTFEGLQCVSSGLLPEGTLLLSSRAPIGYLAIAQTPVAVNQGFIAISPSEKVSNLFLLRWLQIHIDEVKARASGTTFLEISKKNFRPIELIVPSKSEMSLYDKAAGSLFQQVIENERASEKLVSLRDTLLPKLISGELRVPEDIEGLQ